MRYFTWKLEFVSNILSMIVDLFESAEFNSELHFFCLQVETPFLSKFGPKNQNVSLSSNLVPRLIWILEFNGDVNFFFFLIRNTLFGSIISKKPKLSVWGEIRYLDQFKYSEFNGDALFLCFGLEKRFLVKFAPKDKIVSLIWNFVPRLIRISRIQ